VVRVKQAAEAAASGKRLLLMFDELFKGTNVKDAKEFFPAWLVRKAL
jgi:hypothetical protein